MFTLALPRAGAALLAGTVAAGALAASAPRAAAAPDPVAPDAGAAWLDSQIVSGVIHDDFYNFDNYGLTVDAAYALDAVGGYDATLAEIASTLEAHVDNYITGGEWGPNDYYAGSTGKLLAFATDMTATDPEAFGGVDVKGRMEELTTDEGVTAGRIVDQSQYGDFANTFGQTWAVRGLLNTASTEAPAALDFLLQQQCAAGFFRLYFPAADAAGSHTCDGADPAESVPAVDTTAFVVVQLADKRESDPALDAALTEAVTWIKSRQAPDGSFDGGSATEGANANSTGLAGWALRLAGESAAATKAAVWLRGRQVSGFACDGALATERGAIAYDAAALAAGQADGISPATAGQWRTAAVQALPALLAAPATAADLAIAVPRWVKAGSTVTARTAGVAPGARGCVGLAGKRLAVVGGQQTTVSTQLPNRTRTYTAFVDAPGAGRAVDTITALAPKKLPLRLRDDRVRRGDRQRVRVAGLVAGERVVIRYDGERVARGRANSKGVFRAAFRVGRSTGLKTVKVRGRFGTRNNAKTFRVVR